MPNEITPQSAESLRMRMQDLAGMMQRTADSLQRGESVELSYIADEIRNVQNLIGSMADKLRDHPLLAPMERSATDLQGIIDSCRSIQLRQDAIDKLNRLQLVKSFDETDRDGFDKMSSLVNSVITKLTSGSVDDRKRAVEQVMSPDSAYRALYEMITRPEELSDDRWMDNQRQITDAFGRNVTMAVLRGRAR